MPNHPGSFISPPATLGDSPYSWCLKRTVGAHAAGPRQAAPLRSGVNGSMCEGKPNTP